MKPIVNIISLSGGKDSTALAIVALAAGTQHCRFVFADTGHEHPTTYEYIEYLRGALGIDIEVVRADFSARIAQRRESLPARWRAAGIDEATIDRALSVLVPTGNPFLDLCLWKGRFPSTMARFCSEELKHKPITNLILGAMRGAQAVISWQGVRADESLARRDMPMHDIEFGRWEPEPTGHLIYRPIIKWTVEDVFSAHRRAGIRPNPLYSQGMSRVGCMPCIHAKKGDIRQIAARFPAEIDRVREWEALVAAASKRGGATFFPIDAVRGASIDDHVEWSRTSHGGKQRSLTLDEPASCSSLYGLCE